MFIFFSTFQSVLINPFITSLDQQLNGFFWCGKPACIRRSDFQLPKSSFCVMSGHVTILNCSTGLALKVLTCTPCIHTELSYSSFTLLPMICSQLPIEVYKILNKPADTVVLHQLKSVLHKPLVHMLSFTVGQLKVSHDFSSFSSLSAKFNLPNTHLLNFSKFYSKTALSLLLLTLAKDG